MKKDMSKLVQGILRNPVEEENQKTEPQNIHVEQSREERIKSQKNTEEETAEPVSKESFAGIPVDEGDALSRQGEWEQFQEECVNYSKSPRKGVSMWIDDDIADLLNELKNTGSNKVYLRHMVNAMCCVFIQNHKEDIKKAIRANKRRNPFL